MWRAHSHSLIGHAGFVTVRSTMLMSLCISDDVSTSTPSCVPANRLSPITELHLNIPNICEWIAWSTNETCMKYIWNMNERCMIYIIYIYIWNMYERCMIYIWNMYERCMKYVWNVHELCMKLYEKFSGFAKKHP